MTTPMVIVIAAVSAVIAAVIAFLVARSSAAAQRDTFQALAAEALNANRAAFLDLAKTSFTGMQKDAALDLNARQTAIDGLVQPIIATLRDVNTKLAQAERDRTAAY